VIRMLSDATSVAIIAGITALATAGSQVVLAVVVGRQRRREKADEYKRQDEVAEKAAAAASAAAAKAAEVANLLLSANERVARQTSDLAAKTHEKLDQVHVLVNSNYTEEMEARLIVLDANVVLTREVMRLNLAAGSEPTEASKAALANMERMADGLRNALVKRSAAASVAGP